MKIALLFAGQGTDAPTSAIEWAEFSVTTRLLVQRAGMNVHFDMVRALERGGRELQKTEVIQPLVTALNLGVWHELQSAGVTASFVAGHSLGEIAAWSAAGCISADNAIDIARVRGRLMGRLAQQVAGGMLALSSQAAVEEALAHGLELAAHNAPDEWVVTGADADLQRVQDRCGGVRLPVAGPWHSRYMAEAIEPLQRTLRTQLQRPPNAAMVCNRTGQITDPADIPAALAGQMSHPIQWTQTLRTLFASGVDTFVTVGPGRILRALVRKSLGSLATVLTSENPDDLRRTLETLGL